MENETTKSEPEREPKKRRMMHEHKEPRKPVCNCPYGCLDLDTHYTINGGRSVFPTDI